VESAIDFPEEEIDFLQDEQVHRQLDSVSARLNDTLAEAHQGQLLREGMTVVIAGKPNAGKSTLLNQLTGQQSAIVTEIPGTTRDVLREHIQIDGLPLHIIDTAGLRDGADVVEQEGIRRAWQEISRADRILYIVDASEQPRVSDDPLLKQLSEAGPNITVIYNKMDLVSQTPHCDEFENLLISAASGQGVDQLREHLKACVGYHITGEGGFMARRRHLDALQRASEHLAQGREQLCHHAAGELLAEELRQAQQQLAQITGEFTADDLLGKIFASFCIGK
jgi:tRNA modification GTPase